MLDTVHPNDFLIREPIPFPNSRWVCLCVHWLFGVLVKWMVVEVHQSKTQA